MRDHLLYELARDLSSSLELDVVLGKVMDRVITLMSASRGFIVLVDPVTNTMSVKMSSGEADPEKIGLLNDVYDDAEASLAAAHQTAAEIAGNPPLVVNGVKDVLDQQRIARVSESLRYVAAWNAAFLPSNDLSEGLRAHFEKRPPQFSGE